MSYQKHLEVIYVTTKENLNELDERINEQLSNIAALVIIKIIWYRAEIVVVIIV